MIDLFKDRDEVIEFIKRHRNLIDKGDYAKIFNLWWRQFGHSAPLVTLLGDAGYYFGKNIEFNQSMFEMCVDLTLSVSGSYNITREPGKVSIDVDYTDFTLTLVDTGTDKVYFSELDRSTNKTQEYHVTLWQLEGLFNKWGMFDGNEN